jgi:hypothetical protein
MGITIKKGNIDKKSKIKDNPGHGIDQVAGLENVSSEVNRNKLIKFLKSYCIKLPDNFKFDREEANSR